jgi:hypothetical protein
MEDKTFWVGVLVGAIAHHLWWQYKMQCLAQSMALQSQMGPQTGPQIAAGGSMAPDDYAGAGQYNMYNYGIPQVGGVPPTPGVGGQLTLDTSSYAIARGY